jgi:hypothetical protein
MIVIIHPAVWDDPGTPERRGWVGGITNPVVFTDFEDLNRFLAGRGAVLDEPAVADHVPESARPDYAGCPYCEGPGCYRAASRTLIWATETALMITSACARCEPGLKSVAADHARRVHVLPSPVISRRSAHLRASREDMTEFTRALVHARIPGDVAPQPRCARCRHALAPARGERDDADVAWTDAAGLTECRGSAHSPRASAIVGVLAGHDKEPAVV